MKAELAFDKRGNLGVIVIAALFTAGFLLLLPLLETLSRIEGGDRTARRLMTAAVPPPPPPRPMRSPRPRTRVQRTVPKLTTPPRKIPIGAALDIDLASGNLAGEFALNVNILPGNLTEQLKKMVFELTELDEPPQPILRSAPLYPSRARLRKIEGFAEVEFIVGEDGRTREIRIISSKPPGIFDREATRAVERWKFKPGTKDGRSVAVWVRQKLSFELQR